jgi:SEC-C motif-containing protein
MTLILSLMNPAQAILVADRRFTKGGRLFDDERTKTTVLFCSDARALVAFTGLAEAGTFETSRALLKALARTLQPDHLLRLKIQRFALLMTEEIRKLRLGARVRHLTIVFTGFYYYGPVPLPFVCQVTNAANGLDKDATDELVPFWAKQPFGIYGFGARAGVATKDRATLRQLLAEGKPATALVEKAVNTIQLSADSPRSKGLVGKQCNSVILPADPHAGVLAQYHSATLANKIYMPNYVVSTPAASLTNYGSSIEQLDRRANPLVVPKVGRNAPCPCGSGQKYKGCHGTRRP